METGCADTGCTAVTGACVAEAIAEAEPGRAASDEVFLLESVFWVPRVCPVGRVSAVVAVVFDSGLSIDDFPCSGVFQAGRAVEVPGRAEVVAVPGVPGNSPWPHLTACEAVAVPEEAAAGAAPAVPPEAVKPVPVAAPPSSAASGPRPSDSAFREIRSDCKPDRKLSVLESVGSSVGEAVLSEVARLALINDCVGTRFCPDTILIPAPKPTPVPNSLPCTAIMREVRADYVPKMDKQG